MSATISWSRETTRREPAGGDVVITESGSLICDIVTSETYDVSAAVTSHVVEVGTPVTDHIRANADRCTMEVYISESPLVLSHVPGAAMRDVELGSGGNASVVGVPAGTTRAADALRTLQMLCTRGFQVDVEGARIPIVGWVIESVSAPRDPETAGAFVALVTMVEFRTAEFEEIDAPSPRVERGRNRRDRGRRATNSDGTDAEAVPNNESASVAYSTRDALRSFAARNLGVGGSGS